MKRRNRLTLYLALGKQTLYNNGRFIFNVTLSITLGLCVLVQAGAEEKEALKALCSGNAIKLTKISQVSRLIDHIEVYGGIWHCDRVTASISDLKPVIEATRDDVCSKLAIERLSEYYLEYIEVKNKRRDPHGSIPSSVRTFFLALGFSISKTCKKIVVSSLLFDAEALLTEEDFKVIDVWIGSGSPFANIIGVPRDFDDLVLANDAFKEFFGINSQADDGGRLILKTTTRELLLKIQDACQKRFKPIYEQIIVPQVRLSHMGFSYHGEDLQIELDEIATNKKIHKWYKIVYICDALENVLLADGQQGESNVVQILSKEESVMLSRSGESQIKSNLKPIVYERDKLQIEDEVLAEDDKNLAKMINNYSKRKSLGDRIRGQLFSKVTRFAAQLLSSGKVNLVGSMFNEETEDKKKGNSSAKILKNLDMFIHSSNYLDTPVAGASKEEGEEEADEKWKKVTPIIIHLDKKDEKPAFFKWLARELLWSAFLTAILSLFPLFAG